jgi:hypothetical protein
MSSDSRESRAWAEGVEVKSVLGLALKSTSGQSAL